MADLTDTAGRVVIVLLELFCIGTLLYGLATVAAFFVSASPGGRLQSVNQRMID